MWTQVVLCHSKLPVPTPEEQKTEGVGPTGTVSDVTPSHSRSRSPVIVKETQLSRRERVIKCDTHSCSVYLVGREFEPLW